MTLLDTLLAQSSDPIIMMHPENTYHSLTDVLYALYIPTNVNLSDKLQELQAIKAKHHTRCKHQPELQAVHESNLIVELYDFAKKHRPLCNIEDCEPSYSDVYDIE